jgi:hypothetical protein
MPITIRYGAVLPVTQDEAFAFVSDPSNWPLFFDRMEIAEAGPGWGEVGGRARMVNHFLGRRTVSELRVTEWDAPTRFRYVAQHHGRPDLDNLRVFESVEHGTKLIATTTVVPRRGLAGLSDRFARRALQRMVDRGMERLPGVIAERHHITV